MTGKTLMLLGMILASTVVLGADYSIADFGAKSDGSKCSLAFEMAMDACSKAGGGRVTVPAGKWFTGAIHLKSGCELHLEDGSEIVFSQDPSDYLPAVHTSWEGMECWNYSPLVFAYGCTNVAITGSGTLRAFEGEWENTAWCSWVPPDNGVRAARRQLYDWGAEGCPVEKRQIWKMKDAHTRPHFIQFNRCQNVRWEGFKVRNSPFWTLHLYMCDDVEVRGLDVYAHGRNNDGVDIEMSRNVLVEDCIFDQGDDGVVIKSGRNQDAWRLARPTENVLIRNCHIKDAHTVLGVGSEISGGVRNVKMENCRAETPNRVFYLKTNHRRGGFLENITCENVSCREVRVSVFEIGTDVLYEWAKFPDYATALTRIENITAKNIHVDKTRDLIVLDGDERLPPKHIRAIGLAADVVTGRKRVVNHVEDFVELPSPQVSTNGVAPLRSDRLKPVAPGKAHIGGAVGAKLNRFLDHRVRSAFAREVLFPEARAAFEKPDDDVFMRPPTWERPFGMWKGEFWGKLMISACRTAESAGDAALAAWLHEEALRLVALQHPDGYLGTYVDPEYVQPQNWDKVGRDPTERCAFCWNLWCRKYTMWGLLTCWRLTQDAKLLSAVERSMDQELDMLDRLGLRFCDTGTFVGMPSSSVLKPLLLLYQATGKQRYLDSARQIIDDFRREDGRAPNLLANAFLDRPVASWYPSPWNWAKAYEMMSCMDGILEWVRVTGDESALEAMKRVQAMLVEHETNPMFSVGYNDQFANAAHQVNGVTEPCDAIHWMRFNADLFWITGETKYADAIELTFYNAFLAAMFRDGTWGARAVRSHAYHATPRNGQSGMKHQHCCVNNMPRAIADVTSLVAARDADGALCLAFYSDATAEVDGDRISITGNYPYGEDVTITIDKEKPGLVRFRIPAWSVSSPDRGTWRTVEMPAGRSTYRLSLDMRPRILDSVCQPLSVEPGKCEISERSMARCWPLRMWLNYGNDDSLLKLVRRTPAVRVARGPLLLAKAQVVGTPQATMETSESLLGTRPKLSVKAISPSDSVAAWELTVDDGNMFKTIPVCDFPSAGDKYEDGGMRFSIWF